MDLHPSSHHLKFGVKPSVLLLLPSTILLALNMLVLVLRRNVISPVYVYQSLCYILGYVVPKFKIAVSSVLFLCSIFTLLLLLLLLLLTVVV